MISIDHLTDILHKDTYDGNINMFCKTHCAWNYSHDPNIIVIIYT